MAQDELVEFKNKPLILAPAAGWGSRVGSPPAKELLPGPDGRPLIDFVLEQALLRSWPVCVITRAEKISLVEYLRTDRWTERFDGSLEICEIEPTQDWPESLLQSQSFWHGLNIVVLPDTRFEPCSILDQMVAELEDFQVVYAGLSQKDPAVWGSILYERGLLRIAEKVQRGGPCWAWGLMGFRKEVGTQLLRAHLQSTIGRKEIELPLSAQLIPLQGFVDVTRGMA